MLERLTKLAEGLRTIEDTVEGDYKNFFGDRRMQVQSWIRTLQSGHEVDSVYVNEAATEFETLII